MALNLFSEEFIKNKIFPIELEKLVNQLFTWRQKGDYDDLFDFTEDKVKPLIEPVKVLISSIEQYIKEA